MAYKGPLNVSRETWATPQQTSLSDRAKSMWPELFAIAITETDGMPAADRDLSVPGALRHVFESDGMQVVITFAEQTNLNSGFRPKPVSTGVPAWVLPFSWEELVARVGAVLDYSRTNSRVTRFGDVCIDFASMEVSRSSGEQIILTAQEFKALRFFVSNPGRVISRDELLNQAWGYDNYPCSRTVDNHVLKLRQKLEVEPSSPKHFLTVHCVGYKFLP
jgi:DNA-binding winged helix-turn-helix (wHTH) protein